MGVLLVLMVTFPVVTVSYDSSSSSTTGLSFDQSVCVLPSSKDLRMRLETSMPPRASLVIPIGVRKATRLGRSCRVSTGRFAVGTNRADKGLVLVPGGGLADKHRVHLSVGPIGNCMLKSGGVTVVPVRAGRHVVCSFASSCSQMLDAIRV